MMIGTINNSQQKEKSGLNSETKKQNCTNFSIGDTLNLLVTSTTDVVILLSNQIM